MTDNFIAKTIDGEIVCEGTAERVANILKVTKLAVFEACKNKQVVRGKYLLYDADSKDAMTPSKLKEHLYKEDGRRAYGYKKGYPNRYKDASCVRFTPL